MADGNFTRALLCDPDTGLPGCDDGNHLDDADVAIIALHGSDVNRHWRGALRFSGGPPNGDCGIDAPEAGSGEMFLGDSDLEFLHMSSCHSMDDDNCPRPGACSRTRWTRPKTAAASIWPPASTV
jgi:hypothetical protein